ncbi:MAG: hypothetical protein HY716_16080 [Planctomycetes bacterium]|nr:hypothetical protein [Planctomycetota bacterium]
MKAGAFSNQKLAEPTSKIVPILVDLTQRGAHSDLTEKYGVRGIPRVVYTDPDGSVIKEMTGRDVNSIIKDIAEVFGRFPGKGSNWESSLKSALERGKKDKKPVALALVAEDEDLVKWDAKLMKAVGARKKKFSWVLDVAEESTLKKYDLEKGPAVVILNPKTEEVLGKAAIEEDGKFDELNKALDEAAKKK